MRFVIADRRIAYQGEAPSYLNRQFRNSMGDEGHHDERASTTTLGSSGRSLLAKWKWLLGELPAACGRS